MGWSLGFDTKWNRDIGYGVPAYCDHPGCTEEIDRGLAYVCCASQPYGGEHGCGRYYCGKHEANKWEGSGEDGEEDETQVCGHADDDYISPDHHEWIRHKRTDESWQQWRDENPGNYIISLGPPVSL